MGIDAEMFVRHRGVPLSDREIRSIAGRLCSLLGTEGFFVDREPRVFGPHHALSLVETVEQYREEWGDDASLSPDIPGDRQIWTQDGPDIISEPGEQLIQVHFFTRYYGIGYERGDWPLIKTTAEFLEVAIPGCEVWYGGDSAGVCAVPLGPAEREELHRHFLTKGHDPYRSAFGRQTQVCEFCGGRPMHDVGGGQGRRFHECDGCDLKRIEMEDGETFDLAKGQDFFGWKPPLTV